MDAREWARKHGLTFVWAPDGEITDHVAKFDGYDHEPETCEWVALMDDEGNVLASLSCIDDADDAYRRTIEADLMEEVAPNETTCGECGRTWFYPTPASRCPFEYDHEETEEPVTDSERLAHALSKVTHWLASLEANKARLDAASTDWRIMRARIGDLEAVRDILNGSDDDYIRAAGGTK